MIYKWWVFHMSVYRRVLVPSSRKMLLSFSAANWVAFVAQISVVTSLVSPDTAGGSIRFWDMMLCCSCPTVQRMALRILRENLQETMGFPMNYGGFFSIFIAKPIPSTLVSARLRRSLKVELLACRWVEKPGVPLWSKWTQWWIRWKIVKRTEHGFRMI